MTDTDFYEQIQHQLQQIEKEHTFDSCLVSLTDAAQNLGIQPSDIMDLLAKEILTIRSNTENFDIILYGTELNSLAKKIPDWLKLRQNESLNNSCEQFFDTFPKSWYVDDVLTIQKLHVNKLLLTKKSQPTTLAKNLVFSISKNA